MGFGNFWTKSDIEQTNIIILLLLFVYCVGWIDDSDVWIVDKDMYCVIVEFRLSIDYFIM